MTKDRSKSKISTNPPNIKGGKTKNANFNFNYAFVFTGEVRGVYDDTKEQQTKK